MPRYIGTVQSSRSVNDAFDYLADFSSAREWDPSVVRAENLSKRVGEGAEFLIVVRLAGRENEFVYRTVSYVRPSLLVLRAESSSVVSEDTIRLRPIVGGCEVVYDAELRPKGAMRLAEPLLALIFKRLGDNAAAGLRRELA